MPAENGSQLHIVNIWLFIRETFKRLAVDVFHDASNYVYLILYRTFYQPIPVYLISLYIQIINLIFLKNRAPPTQFPHFSFELEYNLLNFVCTANLTPSVYSGYRERYKTNTGKNNLIWLTKILSVENIGQRTVLML